MPLKLLPSNTVTALAVRYALLSCLLASTGDGAAAGREQMPARQQPGAEVAGLETALKQSRLTLELQPAPRFVLHYQGPLAAFRGRLCYRFQGYTETCLRKVPQWLTPATALSFDAPGNVPAELLQGYQLELRLPEMFTRSFRYYVHPQ